MFLSAPTTWAGASMFGGPSASSRAPVATCTFGQTSTGSSLTSGSSAQSHTSQSLPFYQGTKPATTCSTGTAVTPFVLDPGASSNIPTTSGFNLGATTTFSSAGTFRKKKHAVLFLDCLSSSVRQLLGNNPASYHGTSWVPLGHVYPISCTYLPHSITNILFSSLISLPLISSYSNLSRSVTFGFSKCSF